MIIKKRQKPLILQKYEILQARLPKDSPHYRQVTFDANNYKKGYEGERAVDYYLQLLSPSDFTILQDITLKTKDHTFQIDNLLVSHHAIYLIEVKNYLSRVTYHADTDTFILDNEQREFGTANPLIQVKIQKEKLRIWLQERNLPNIPIHCFVALSNSSTILEITGNPNENTKGLSHGEQIPWKITDIEEKYHKEPKHQHQKIAYKILTASTEFDKDILSIYPIHSSELLRGVRCIKCNYLGMRRKGWSWKCPSCSFEDKLAAQQSINEYLLLIKPWLTNKECKHFLGLESRHTSLRQLKKMPGLTYNQVRNRWEKN